MTSCARGFLRYAYSSDRFFTASLVVCDAAHNLHLSSCFSCVSPGTSSHSWVLWEADSETEFHVYDVCWEPLKSVPLGKVGRKQDLTKGKVELWYWTDNLSQLNSQETLELKWVVCWDEVTRPLKLHVDQQLHVDHP